jgi:hypothetical protein
MKWLLTTPTGVDLERLREDLAAAGGTLEDQDPVPLEPGEQVVHADGPDDLPERLRESGTLLAVYPSSEMELH